MLHLFLLRHGKATKYQDDTTDFNRVLNKQGTAQVNQIGYILKANGVVVNHILASSAARTSETAEIVNHFLKCKSIEFDRNLYLADYKTILKKISETNKGDTLLFVGHNNGISDFASYITGQPILLSTGQLVEIRFNFESWKMISAGTGSTNLIIKPDVHSF
jgi:phosphohistidine phosphatase